MNYYLDECGHTGDLISDKYDFNYSNQRLFALTAIGLTKHNHKLLSTFIEELKKKHKIQGVELKSKNLIPNNIEFVIELFSKLHEIKSPIFIELVDKRFLTATNISNYQIDPGYFNPRNTLDKTKLALDVMFKNKFAEDLTALEDTSFLEKYIDCCLNPTEENLRASFANTKESIINNKDKFEYHELLIRCLDETLDDYRILKEQEGDDAVLRFLPLPDKSKSGKFIWLLPHISSLSNIVFRINKKYNKKISKIKFHHDTQVQLDTILQGNLSGLLKLNIVAPYVKGVNYSINCIPTLKFEDSKKEIGIQIADIISGFVVRYTFDRLFSSKDIDERYHVAASLIEGIFPSNKNPVGINYVMPIELVRDRAIPNVQI
ncbi:DUF3800 domain-containing protein [Yersinia enterocolitica]|jgi:hypothetical protein|uniref:DUF3800 domain-containing protein n=1 Tax=Yersinia enterocolitica TaxID=630 RepID=UPI00398CAE00